MSWASHQGLHIDPFLANQNSCRSEKGQCKRIKDKKRFWFFFYSCCPFFQQTRVSPFSLTGPCGMVLDFAKKGCKVIQLP